MKVEHADDLRALNDSDWYAKLKKKQKKWMEEVNWER